MSLILNNPQGSDHSWLISGLQPFWAHALLSLEGSIFLWQRLNFQLDGWITFSGWWLFSYSSAAHDSPPSFTLGTPCKHCSLEPYVLIGSILSCLWPPLTFICTFVFIHGLTTCRKSCIQLLLLDPELYKGRILGRILYFPQGLDNSWQLSLGSN